MTSSTLLNSYVVGLSHIKKTTFNDAIYLLNIWGPFSLSIILFLRRKSIEPQSCYFIALLKKNLKDTLQVWSNTCHFLNEYCVPHSMLICSIYLLFIYIHLTPTPDTEVFIHFHFTETCPWLVREKTEILKKGRLDFQSSVLVNDLQYGLLYLKDGNIKVQRT